MIECKIRPVKVRDFNEISSLSKSLNVVQNYTGNLSRGKNKTEANVKITKGKLLDIIASLLDDPDTSLIIQTPDIVITVEAE